MLTALRKIRLICGLIAVGGYVLLGASHVVALLTRSPGNGFLGGAEPFVFVIANALFAGAVISIPYLRETVHPGAPERTVTRKR